jgi:phage-related minor tail protein
VPSSADAAPAVAFDGDAFAAALRRLSEQLQDADMAATDTMANLQMTFGALVGARLQRLDEAVNALDFERALGLCLELMRSPVEGTV